MSEIFFFHFREAPVQCSSAFGNWAEASENNGAVVMCADFVPPTADRPGEKCVQ